MRSDDGVLVPWCICSLLGVMVIVAIGLLGVLGGAELALANAVDDLAAGEISRVAIGWEIGAPALLCSALVAAMLWSPGQWRRVVLMLTTLIIFVGLLFVFAVWGRFFSPLAGSLGLLWGGICSLVYAQRHPMPCEVNH